MSSFIFIIFTGNGKIIEKIKKNILFTGCYIRSFKEPMVLLNQDSWYDFTQQPAGTGSILIDSQNGFEERTFWMTPSFSGN